MRPFHKWHICLAPALLHLGCQRCFAFSCPLVLLPLPPFCTALVRECHTCLGFPPSPSLLPFRIWAASAASHFPARSRSYPSPPSVQRWCVNVILSTLLFPLALPRLGCWHCSGISRLLALLSFPFSHPSCWCVKVILTLIFHSCLPICLPFLHIWATSTAPLLRIFLPLHPPHRLGLPSFPF